MSDNSPNPNHYRFRVFISYAHADKPLIQKMVQIIEGLGLQPIWDIDINPGKPFTDEIKELIARSHLFFPVITENSQERPWVHQETGFAIALNIPVLPISIGNVPSEMIATIQSVAVHEDLSDLADRLNEINLMQLVDPNPRRPYGAVEVAEWPEERAKIISENAQWMIDLDEYGMVRQQARFSAFSVPDRPISHPIWNERDGNSVKSDYLRHLQRTERQIVEQHARSAGCKMIIDPHAGTFDTQGEGAHKARLSVLLDFIQSMPPGLLQIVISPHAQETNLLVIGDHFMAESKAARPGGYLQTICYTHPPTVLQRLRKFDHLFAELQAERRYSLDQVVQEIKQAISR